MKRFWMILCFLFLLSCKGKEPRSAVEAQATSTDKRVDPFENTWMDYSIPLNWIDQDDGLNSLPMDVPLPKAEKLKALIPQEYKESEYFWIEYFQRDKQLVEFLDNPGLVEKCIDHLKRATEFYWIKDNKFETLNWGDEKLIPELKLNRNQKIKLLRSLWSVTLSACIQDRSGIARLLANDFEGNKHFLEKIHNDLIQGIIQLNNPEDDRRSLRFFAWATSRVEYGALAFNLYIKTLEKVDGGFYDKKDLALVVVLDLMRTRAYFLAFAYDKMPWIER